MINSRTVRALALSSCLAVAVALTGGAQAVAATAGTAAPALAQQVSFQHAPSPRVVRPMLTNTTTTYYGTYSHGSETVDVYWGFDYSPASNNVRALGELFGNTSTIHLTASPIRLGDNNGVLANTTANATNGSLVAETAANIACHPAGTYISNLYFSIRWSDGSLTSGQSTGQFSASASLICS